MNVDYLKRKDAWVMNSTSICLRALMSISLAATAHGSVDKSISGWVNCNVSSEQTEGVARAIAAAAHSAFTLIVDCPVRVHIGSDISRSIFIDDGTSITFTGPGKFTVDNVLIPAFVIANSSNINLTDWDLEYDGSLPADPGRFQAGFQGDLRGDPRAAAHGTPRGASGAHPANEFNDLRITPWLAANRGITFDRSQGGVHSVWAGPSNASALFFIAGDTSNVAVTGMRVSAPVTAGADRFAPMVFSLSKNYKSHQTVTAKTPMTGQYVAIPHHLSFSNITFDGTYMGWQGNAANVLIQNVQSHRYADLQDAAGENVGGVDNWFAPPHLIYLNYADTGDPALFNRNIRITNVVDDGPRVGAARNTKSGNALSLKIGCVACSVDHYTSRRPDGFLDVLASDGLTISNAAATYDSTFESNQWPAWRFPSSGYSRLTFENIVLEDSAAETIHPPIDGAGQLSNQNIVFSHVRVHLNRWAGAGRLLPDIAGQGNDVALEYVIAADSSRLVSVQKGAVSLTLRATPVEVAAGGAAELVWTSRGGGACSASGTWSGALAPEGSRSVSLATAGPHDFTIACQNSGDPTTATVRVVAEK